MRKFESSQKDECRPSLLIPRKPTENLDLLLAIHNSV